MTIGGRQWTKSAKRKGWCAYDFLVVGKHSYAREEVCVGRTRWLYDPMAVAENLYGGRYNAFSYAYDRNNKWAVF